MKTARKPSTQGSTDVAAGAPDIAGVAFLGRLSERLSALIETQTLAVFERMGIVIPVRSCSLMVTLSRLEPAAAADLARELGQAHQLVLQKLPKLVRLSLISREQDRLDARRTLFRITGKGRDQLETFARCKDLIAGAYEELFAETGNVHELIVRALDALEKRPLADRLAAPRT